MTDTIASLKAELAAAREERNEAQLDAKGIPGMRAEANDLRREIEGLRRANEHHRDGMGYWTKRAEAAESALDAERTSNEGLREELRDMHHQCAVIEEERAAERTSAEGLRAIALRLSFGGIGGICQTCGGLRAQGHRSECPHAALALPYEAPAAESSRALHADWLIDRLCEAAQIELRADARALIKARVERALNPELPL